MPPSKHRRLVMDLDSNNSPTNSRKSSLSIPPYHHTNRRSSASQINSSSQSAITVSFLASQSASKRSPLAPLDLQLSSTLFLDSKMSQDEDDLPDAGSRKSSITLTNATRPTPFSQRNLPRRPLPSQGRRTSLPTLHLPAATVPTAVPDSNTHIPSSSVGFYDLALAGSQDDDMYSRLSTFTFGDAPAAAQGGDENIATTSTNNNSDGVSPFHRSKNFDTTPRQSLSMVASPPSTAPLSGRQNGWSSPSEDEEERHRDSRAKMRAIDDGSRRPSLPNNNESSYSPSRPSSTADKGKAKADLEHSSSTLQQPITVLSSPASQTEFDVDHDLDTDVDFMATDDSVCHLRGFLGNSRDVRRDDGEGSDMGSVQGHDLQLLDEDEERADEMDEDEAGLGERETSMKFNSILYSTDGDDRRRRSLPTTVSLSNTTKAQQHYHQQHHQHQQQVPQHYSPRTSANIARDDIQQESKNNLKIASGSRRASQDSRPGSEYEMHVLSHAQMRRGSRSVDDDIQLAGLHQLQRQQQAAAGVASRTSNVDSASASGNAIASATASTTIGLTRQLSATTSGKTSSEPDIRGVAMAQAMAQAQAQAQASSNRQDFTSGTAATSTSNDGGNFVDATNDSPYQGLDLNYILSGSNSSGSGAGVDLGLGGAGSLGGFDPIYAWGSRISVAAEGAGAGASGGSGHAQREHGWALGWAVGSNMGRRQSTATVDDTFLKFVKNNDFTYDERRREWSFLREHGHIEGVPDRRHQEIWRCLWIGRYKVEKLQSKNNDPNKPPQVRLNIKHVVDPHSKGNTRGGPTTFIHKHSRAQAFSIFRGHSIPQRHLKQSSSILLAPKRVQEQFTSTRTTSKLSTHGLLDDKSTTSSSSRTTGAGPSTSTGQTTSAGSVSSAGGMPSSPKGKGKERERTPGEVDKKGKGVAKPTDMDEDAIVPLHASSPSRFAGTQEGLSNNSITMDKLVIVPPRDSSMKTSPPHPAPSGLSPVIEYSERQLEKHQKSSRMKKENVKTVTAPVASESSNMFTSVISSWGEDLPSSAVLPHAQSDGLTQQKVVSGQQEQGRVQPRAIGSIGSIDEQPLVRTSHAEAFATLDPPSIELLRSQTGLMDIGGGDHDSGPFRFKGIRKLFHPQPTKSTQKGTLSASGPHATVLEGRYTPPWLTMTARSKQEEQERVIKNLNDSFRDVGLLPSFTKPGKPRQKAKSRKTSENVFDTIPDESLYMLLPMWPGETDSVSMNHGDDATMYDIPLHERQYLLVYYVPMPGKEKKDDKKRSRHAQSTSSSGAAHLESQASSHSKDKNSVYLTSFNILARLVSYKDVNGSGIRLPASGLSVTGPMTKAIRAIPQVRYQADDLSVIIGFCDRRERGVEIVPEGTEKLGLCLERVSPDPDSDAPLSSLGRAAVELAWIGALAVMGFHHIQ